MAWRSLKVNIKWVEHWTTFERWKWNCSTSLRSILFRPLHSHSRSVTPSRHVCLTRQEQGSGLKKCLERKMIRRLMVTGSDGLCVLQNWVIYLCACFESICWFIESSSKPEENVDFRFRLPSIRKRANETQMENDCWKIPKNSNMARTMKKFDEFA